MALQKEIIMKYARLLHDDPDGAQALYDDTRARGDTDTLELLDLSRNLKQYFLGEDDGGAGVTADISPFSPKPSPLSARARIDFE
jgi:hypothetical protein